MSAGHYSIDARFTDTQGNGVGRWRTYFGARCQIEDLDEISWWLRDLVPSAQMRVRRGRDVVVPPQRVSEYLAAHPREALA